MAGHAKLQNLRAVVMFQLLFTEAPDGRYYIQWFISGLGWTIALPVLGWWIAFVVGLAVGVGRKVVARSVAFMTAAFVGVFRDLHGRVPMVFLFFALPELLAPCN